MLRNRSRCQLWCLDRAFPDLNKMSCRIPPTTHAGTNIHQHTPTRTKPSTTHFMKQNKKMKKQHLIRNSEVFSLLPPIKNVFDDAAIMQI